MSMRPHLRLDPRIVLAQMRKDFLALRWLWIVWAACIAIDFGSYWIPSLFAFFSGVSGIGSALGLGFASLMQFPLVLLLVVAVVQEDPLTEPDAFWRTRPIARAELLAAKLALLVGFSLVTLAAWSHFVGKGLFLSTSVWVFLAGLAAFASVTPTAVRLVGTFIVVALGATIAASLLKEPNHGHAWWAVGESLRASLLIAGFLGVLAHQYLTLRTRVSLGLLAGLLLLAGLVSR